MNVGPQTILKTQENISHMFFPKKNTSKRSTTVYFWNMTNVVPLNDNNSNSMSYSENTYTPFINTLKSNADSNVTESIYLSSTAKHRTDTFSERNYEEMPKDYVLHININPETKRKTLMENSLNETSKNVIELNPKTAEEGLPAYESSKILTFYTILENYLKTKNMSLLDDPENFIKELEQNK